MTFSAKEMIRKRKSVRTFTGEPLKNEDRAAIDQYIQSPTNPLRFLLFGVTQDLMK